MAIPTGEGVISVLLMLLYWFPGAAPCEINLFCVGGLMRFCSWICFLHPCPAPDFKDDVETCVSVTGVSK